MTTPFCVGTKVTGAGIPNGTYLKRIFPGKEWFELSQPVTDTIAGNDLVFERFSPKVHFRINRYLPNNSDVNNEINVGKYAAEDTMELEFGSLTLFAKGKSTLKQLSFGVPGKDDVDLVKPLVPGRVIIHEVGLVTDSNVELRTCDILFSTTPQAAYPGFPKSVVRQPMANAAAQLSVTGTMTAAIGELKDFKGSITKNGSGTLLVGFATNQVANTGRLIVSEGMFAIANPDEGCKTSDEVARVGALEVAAGATLRLPERGLRVTGSVTVAEGGVIAGPGALYVTGNVSTETLTLRDGARIVYEGAMTAIDSPLPDEVPGDPAFWVDISKTETVVQKSWRGMIGVTRINDCRKKSEDDGYLFSTNCSDGTYLPVLWKDPRTGWSVYFHGQYESWASAEPLPAIRPDLSDTHAWSKMVTGIRAVFQVYSMMGKAKGGDYVGYGGNFLGVIAAKSDWSAAWNRYRYDWTRKFSDGFFTWGSKTLDVGLKRSTIHMNGVTPGPTDKTYPYASYYASSGVTNVQPVVVSVIVDPALADFPEANSYDYNYSCGNQMASGNKFLSELIVYTNAVTEADRLQITSYLMKKWKNCEIAYAPVQSDGTKQGAVDLSKAGEFGVVEGSAYVVEALTGEGKLTKSGKGRLLVGSVKTTGSSSLDVAEGTLEISSVVATADTLPANPQAHLDASDPSAFTCTVDESGATNVLKWVDVRGESVQAAVPRSECTNFSKLCTSERLGGKSYVDFGPARYWETKNWKEAPCLGFSKKNNNQHTVVAVWGSEHGGGNLAGGPGADYYIDSAWTLTRGGPLGQPLGASKDANVLRVRNAQLYNLQFASAYRFRKNGIACNPFSTGLSGDFDIVSLVSDDPFGVGGLSGVNNVAEYGGGEQFAEYLVYDRGLSEPDVALIEAYLRKKWFGVSTPGYEGASFADVRVSSNATLKVVGNAPLSVGKLNVTGGVIDGKVAFQADARIVVEVAPDGSTKAMRANGCWDFSQGGTVSYAGDVERLTIGRHVVLSNVPGFPIDRWTLAPWSYRPNRFVRLEMIDGDLVLDVSKPGCSVLVR